MILQICSAIQTAILLLFIGIGIALLANTGKKLESFERSLEMIEYHNKRHFEIQDGRLAKVVGILESGWAFQTPPSLNIRAGNGDTIQLNSSPTNR